MAIRFRHTAFLPLLVSTSLLAEVNKIKAKIEPLSEELLLFLAEMEEVDGEFVHPVDLQNNSVKQEVAKVDKDEATEGKKDVK